MIMFEFCCFFLLAELSSFVHLPFLKLSVINLRVFVRRLIVGHKQYRAWLDYIDVVNWSGSIQLAMSNHFQFQLGKG